MNTRFWKHVVSGLMVAVCVAAFVSESFAANLGTLKWSCRVGPIIDHSAPSIGSHGTIYVEATNGLYAVKPDGSLKWHLREVRLESSHFLSPAIGGDGTIYAGTGNKLYAINLNGTVKWTFTTEDSVNCSPALGLDGTIYVGGPYGVYAIKPDGSLNWRFNTGLVFSLAIGSNRIIYAGTDDGLYAINPDGTLKWRFTTGDSVDCPLAIGADGTIYLGAVDAFYVINPDGTLKWRTETLSGFDFSPVVGPDGTIYVVGEEDSSLYAINPDGSLKWQFSASSHSSFSSSPTIGADGTIYVGVNDDNLYAVNPSGSLKWRFKTFSPWSIQSSPAMGADGTIYVGSDDGRLYALNSSSSGPANSPWPMMYHDSRHTARAEAVGDTAAGYPFNPLTAVSLDTTVNPEDHVVTVAPGRVIIRPSLSVPTEDQGKQAQLLMYIYLPEYGGIPLLYGPTVTLSNVVTFDSFFPDPIDLSDYPGLVVDIYYGYFLPDGEIKYNAYELSITPQ